MSVTQKQIQAARAELARRELMARDLLFFTEQTEHEYKAGWVHRDICQRLEQFSRDVKEEKSPRLMLLVPPRHGKSTLASQMLPAWHLGKYPHHEIMNVGYNLDLPTEFSRKVRQVCTSKQYQAVFPDTKLDPRSQSVERWKTLQGGGFKAAGIGGGLTGMGAHIMIIDDPIKNMEEADNPEHRAKLEEWYSSVAYSRLAPGGGVLFIETMWHDDDLAGRLMHKMEAEEDADQFVIIRYPAIAEKYEYRHRETLEMMRDESPVDDPDWELLRKPGEALHPERYDIEALNKRKNNSSARVWSALYQQNPVPDSGMVFQESDFHIVPELPPKEYCRYFMAWDFAISTKQHADYTVGVCLQMTEDGNLYVCDFRRFRGGADRICAEFIDMAQRWSVYHQSSIEIGIENGQIYKALQPVLRNAMREEELMFPITTLQAISDKKVRANPLQGRMQHKKLFFTEQIPGFKDIKHEMLRFPAGKHDDIVDALAWAVQLAQERGPVHRPKPKAQKSWKDKLRVGRRLSGSHMAA